MKKIIFFYQVTKARAHHRGLLSISAVVFWTALSQAKIPGDNTAFTADTDIQIISHTSDFVMSDRNQTPHCKTLSSTTTYRLKEITLSQPLLHQTTDTGKKNHKKNERVHCQFPAKAFKNIQPWHFWNCHEYIALGSWNVSVSMHLSHIFFYTLHYCTYKQYGFAKCKICRLYAQEAQFI